MCSVVDDDTHTHPERYECLISQSEYNISL